MKFLSSGRFFGKAVRESYFYDMSVIEKEIWTVGHSTRSREDFLELLSSFGIEQLVDVRRYPGSRKFPHFANEQLEVWLPEDGVAYLHLEDLGGRRKARKDSGNTAWRLPSFRGYADYMETDAFREAAQKLQEVASRKRTAYMCSEAVWWSCHRSLISDYLKIRSWRVMHIMGAGRAMEHPYTEPARVVDRKLIYGAKNT